MVMGLAFTSARGASFLMVSGFIRVTLKPVQPNDRSTVSADSNAAWKPREVSREQE